MQKTPKKAFLFADKKLGIGLGHMSRTKALANLLEQNHYQAKILDCIFLESFKESCDLMSIDSYTLPIDSYYQATSLARVCIFFDDTLRLPYPKGILLNASLGADLQSYKNKYPNHTLWIGKGYTLLQKPFLQLLNTPHKLHKTIKNIMVTLGGADILGLTKWLCEELYTFNPNFQIHYIHKDKHLFKKAKGYSNLNATQMANLFSQMDLCICACGQTLSESIACKVPTLGLEVAINQRANLIGYANCIESIKEVWTLDKEALKTQLLQSIIRFKDLSYRELLVKRGFLLFCENTQWKEGFKALKTLLE
ncbi:hypothetical protein LS72_008440 [Helicobacter apodemus]|uniref:UDP-2,4-diacetamido-2,4, 6-trideoxy-beta-L-altropyranose hydrolase n=1 Tax=Helicobacter apodemus TaxID=135569 RepID=A0A4U8UFW0_9HELI|nr:hypothetical protein [Helicobacter apodemus]TLE14519.1 hypothetical protein LS72_008440 [Helicobacter apodemus]